MARAFPTKKLGFYLLVFLGCIFISLLLIRAVSEAFEDNVVEYPLKNPNGSFTIKKSDLPANTAISNIYFKTFNKGAWSNPMDQSTLGGRYDVGGTSLSFFDGTKVLRGQKASGVLGTQVKMPQPVSKLSGDIKINNIGGATLGVFDQTGDSSKGGSNVIVGLTLI